MEESIAALTACTEGHCDVFLAWKDIDGMRRYLYPKFIYTKKVQAALLIASPSLFFI